MVVYWNLVPIHYWIKGRSRDPPISEAWPRFLVKQLLSPAFSFTCSVKKTQVPTRFSLVQEQKRHSKRPIFYHLPTGNLWSGVIIKTKPFLLLLEKNLVKTDIGIKIKQNNEGLISIHVRFHEVFRSKILIFS
jgi:hypothetical protein